jgi:hypothetical protein
MLKGHLAELRAELAALEHAAAHVARGEAVKRTGGTQSNSDAGPSAG